ncbi:kinase-like domain-containing protein, partial [Tribonema minus]
QVLGVGSTSTCYRCLDRSTGQAFACKLIDKRAVEQKFKGLLEQFHNEISVLRQLRHPHIIFLKDAFETETRIHMVLEIMEGGELFDFVVNRGTLSEAEAARMLRGVASALAYMHSMGIIHRDLKPENLLISKDASTVKIIDFGLCKALEEHAQAKSFLGTRGYLAPEMLQRESYSKAVDVWALGVICFVLLCGCLPFDDDSSRINRKSAMAKFVLRFPRWAQNLSPHAKDLLGGLLDVNPATRLTAQAALDHPWLSGAVAAATNMLESPKALRQQLPRIRSPHYATPSAGGQFASCSR